MKKIILLCLTLFSLANAWDSESSFKNKDINWLSYKESLKQTNNKMMFVFIEANGCGYCEKAKDNMENSNAFKTYLGENFKAVKINKSEDYVPNQFNSNMTPAFYISDKNGKLLDGPFIGLQPINVLLQRMNMQLNKETK